MEIKVKYDACVVITYMVFTSFKVKEFYCHPSTELLQDAEMLKDDWKFIDKFFDIEYRCSNTKAQLREIVLEGLVKEHLPPSALQLKESHSDSPEASLNGDNNFAQESKIATLLALQTLET